MISTPNRSTSRVNYTPPGAVHSIVHKNNIDQRDGEGELVRNNATAAAAAAVSPIKTVYTYRGSIF